ncbi:hypothetical protein K5D68_03575, partial [Pseudomonas cichorii]|nr:hypothetical protein [Pseudomonas cichorii]
MAQATGKYIEQHAKIQSQGNAGTVGSRKFHDRNFSTAGLESRTLKDNACLRQSATGITCRRELLNHCTPSDNLSQLVISGNDLKVAPPLRWQFHPL